MAVTSTINLDEDEINRILEIFHDLHHSRRISYHEISKEEFFTILLKNPFDIQILRDAMHDTLWLGRTGQFNNVI